jgi:hypothetical protein
MRSGPISVTVAGRVACCAANVYSASGTLRTSSSRCVTGQRTSLPCSFSRTGRVSSGGASVTAWRLSSWRHGSTPATSAKLSMKWLRRNSPSETIGSPCRSSSAISATIASSWTAVSSSSGNVPSTCAVAAAFSAGVRKKLPTMSTRSVSSEGRPAEIMTGCYYASTLDPWRWLESSALPARIRYGLKAIAPAGPVPGIVSPLVGALVPGA